ncbi:virulence factor Mce family protein, partial [Mycobacterium intracellulare]
MLAAGHPRTCGPHRSWSWTPGNSLAPYNHLDTGSPYAIEYVWGRQVGDNTI